MAKIAIPLALGGNVQAGTLERLIGEALGTHPMVEASNKRVTAAEDAEEGARYQFFPTPYVSAQGRGSGRNTYYNGDPAVTTIGVSQPLWTGGRLIAGLEKAGATKAQANATLAQSRQQIAIRLVQIYGDWFAAKQKRTAYENGRILHERMLAQVIRRINEGASPPSDRILAQARLASLEADLTSARTQENIGLARLSQLLGRQILDIELRSSAAPIPNDLPIEDTLAKGRRDNPALKQYRAEARLQRANIAEREADLWPEITLRVEHQQGNLASAGVSPGTTVFIALSSRLGGGLSTWSGISEARGRYAAAEADVLTQERDIIEQILADHALLNDIPIRRKALAAAVEASEATLTSWDRQFLAGRKTWQDLLNSARDLIQVQAQMADVDAAEIVASWRLFLLSRGVDAALSVEDSLSARKPGRPNTSDLP